MDWFLYDIGFRHERVNTKLFMVSSDVWNISIYVASKNTSHVMYLILKKQFSRNISVISTISTKTP